MNVKRDDKQTCFLKLLLAVLVYSIPGTLTAQEIVVRFDGNKISVEEAFERIEQQSAYTIAFNHIDLDLKKTIILPSAGIDLDKALNLILEGSGCIYKMNSRHIIIIPVPQTGNKTISSQLSGSFIYTGTVFDKKSGSGLGYATVSLLDAEGKAFLSGVTNDTGQFRLSHRLQAFRLRISFVGYQTIYQDVETRQKDLGDFWMEGEERSLDEVLVTAGKVDHLVDRTSYIVTSEMRQGASNAQDLLDKIHGVRLDKTTNVIKVGNESSVLLLVDGMEQPQEYIKNLLPERISKIEVITEPSGRYMSIGYTAIINFILKKEYIGHDVSLRNYVILNPAGTNGSDPLADEQLTTGLTYTNKNINVYSMYTYDRSRWNTPVARDVSYKDNLSWSTKDVSTKKPNNFYKSYANNLSAGINYQVLRGHALSFQIDYLSNSIDMEKQEIMGHAELTDPGYVSLSSVTVDRMKDENYVGTVFYKGEVSDRLYLYSDFSYNYYSDHVDNQYSLTNLNEKPTSFNRNLYRENKKLTAFHAEGTFLWSEKVLLNAGYSNVWRNYGSNSTAGDNFLRYNESRNRFYLYVSISTSTKLKMKLGMALEHINIDNKGPEKKHLNLQPYLQVNYTANDKLNINASYSTDIDYPSLYQLSPMNTAIDTILKQVGNPDLRSVTSYKAAIRLSYRNRLTIIPIFKYIPDNISETYTRKRDGYFFRSFDNVDVKRFQLQAIYDQPVGANFYLKNSVTYYYSKATFEHSRSSVQGWLMDSEINYFNPKHDLNVSFGYHRGMEKNILLGGYQMVNMDNWVFSLNKQFWDKKLSVSFSYIPPIGLGIRHEQTKEIETSNFYEKTSLNLKTYDQMLFLRIGFRFKGGKVKRMGKETRIDPEIREKRTIKF